MKIRKWGCEFEQLPPSARAKVYAKLGGMGALNALVTYVSLLTGLWGPYSLCINVAFAAFASRHYRRAGAQVTPYVESPFNDYFNMLFSVVIAPYLCLFAYLFSAASDRRIEIMTTKNLYVMDFILQIPVFGIHAVETWPSAIVRAVFGILFLAWSVFLTAIPSVVNAFDMRDYWVRLFRSDRHPVTWLFTALTSIFMSGLAPGLINLTQAVQHDEGKVHGGESTAALIFLLGGAPALSFWIAVSSVLGYGVFIKRKLKAAAKTPAD